MKKLLYVEIYGRMAHFRKVFTNSTSLSYYFPPRTTVMGIVAAVSGKKRDSYYKELDALDYAIEALTPLKKLVFGENYLDTDSVNVKKFRGVGNRVPITKEFIVASKGDFLGYGLYMTYNKEVEEAFKSPKYPLALGTAEMLGWIEKVSVEECEEVKDFTGKSVYGALPASFSVEAGTVITLEYGMPRRFEEGRMSGRLHNYFFPSNGSAVKVKSGEAEGVRCGNKHLVFL